LSDQIGRMIFSVNSTTYSCFNGVARLSNNRRKMIDIFIAVMAILLFVPQPVIAETLTSKINPQCQQIELPSDKELVNFDSLRERYSVEKYRGNKIGNIYVVNLPVFNLDDPDENNAFFRFINRVHFHTRHDVIRRQLLFDEGDDIQPRVITESERLLRGNSYLSDAVVLPYQLCDDSLDVVVVVRDLWTMRPQFFISRNGGFNKYGISLEDNNIFGSGNSMFLQFVNDRERDTKAIGFGTKHLFGTRVSLDTVYQDATDGFSKILNVVRPFFSLDTSWSYGINLKERIFEESLQELNQNIVTFDHFENEYQVFAGYSTGLIKGYTQRYIFGFKRTEDIFESTDITATTPNDRILAYPWLAYSIIEDNIAMYKNLNVLYRTEDVPVGLGFSTSLGYADDRFGSELSQWVFTLSLSDSPLKLSQHLLKTKFEVEGFWDRDAHDFVNTVSSFNLSYHWLKSAKQRLFVGLTYDHGKNLASDKLLPLGGDEGLRGYPSEYLLGERRLLLNLEHRHIFDAHYLNIVRFAGVIFFDMGQTSNHSNSVASDSEFLTSTGIGVRMSSSKTNIGNIVHIDLAFPLQQRDIVGDYEFRITGEATF
jgi:hypothetical protein